MVTKIASERATKSHMPLLEVVAEDNGWHDGDRNRGFIAIVVDVTQAVVEDHIAGEPYVMLTVDEANQTATRYWKPTGLRPNIVIRTSSVEAVRSLVADIPTMDVGLAWNINRAQSPAARTFHEFLSLSFGGAGSSM